MKKILIFLMMSLLYSNMLFGSPEITFELIHPMIDVYTGGKGDFKVAIKIPEGYYVALQEDYLGIDIESQGGITAGNTFYPEAVPDQYGGFRYYDVVVLGKEIHIAKNMPLGFRTVKVFLFYQSCDVSGTCFPPEDVEFEIVLNIMQGDDAVADRSEVMKILQFLLLAFAGGVILNLMPCVLPVLTMRAFAMVKQSTESRKAIFLDSVFYTLGIVFTFVMLALVITIIKLSGESVGWGFQFQNTGFVIFLLSLMFVFALAMFDAFIIQLPGVNSMSGANNKKGYLGSFLMGIFAVFIATPCTAPMLGAALGFAFSQPPAIIFAIFILVGFGLGFPFLMISAFPKLIKLLPKPGEWMNIFKELLGFMLFGFAISMLGVVQIQIGGDFIVKKLLPFALVLRIAVWVYGRFVTPMYSKIVQWIMAGVVVLLITGGGIFFLHDLTPRTETTEGETMADTFWIRFSERAVEEAKEMGKPIFIDFTAAYCTVCKQNAALVLNTSDIRAAFEDKGVVMLKGDYTRRDVVIREWLQRHDRAGVPLYLLFIPGQEKPIIFPEVLTKSMIYEALNRLEN